MIFLDILFIICFAPFQKMNNGRAVAIIFLIQIIGFAGLGFFNILFFMIGINLSSIAIGILGTVIATGVYLIFDKIYVKENRSVGVIKLPFLMGVLVFFLLIFSMFYLIFSLARY
jgi:hypothetical protein